MAEIAELTKSPADAPSSRTWNADQWYNFARLYVFAGGKVADKKQEYADRAMALLHQAVKAGFKDAGYLKKDTDLDPLRGRADFRKLLADLEATAGKE